METRPYFVFGDIVTNAAAGASAALIVWLVVSPSWHPVLGMAAGMVLGMLGAAPVSFLFMPLFGAFEVMLPAMFSGMLGGMLLGMAAAMRPTSALEASVIGALAGIASMAWVFFLTARAATRR